jgi:hypothetical protein
VRINEREELRQRYDYRCGYCGTSEAGAGSELTRDRFQPTSKGRAETSDNYVYACHACNEFKSDYWQDAPENAERILHPLRDDMTAHIRHKEDGTLEGLTITGTFHIEHLHLNRDALVAQRLMTMREAGKDRRLDDLEARVEQISEALERLLTRS